LCRWWIKSNLLKTSRGPPQDFFKKYYAYYSNFNSKFAGIYKNHINGLTEMKKIFENEYLAPLVKSMTCQKAFALRGTAFTIDAHSICYCLSTAFFPRR
jgi:hypothetical protein